MRRIIFIITAASALGVGWWLYNNHEHALGIVQQYVENGEFVTLEARYSPEQIMEAHRGELLVSAQHTFGDYGLKFHPYLMMEVKYAQPDKKPREGVLFWSLVDGEMVLNADTWEKTHGFEDAITANASRTDFKLMNALAKNKGTASFDQLQKELRVEKETLQSWIHSAIGKHLIIQTGNGLQLHFQDPKILVQPETTVSQWLVAKPYDNAQRIGRKYSNTQIRKVTTSAFGDDFKIRTMTEVFLPVYSIEVHNPDGSVRTSYWNALNGQKIQPKYLTRR
jgi:hypothetical protein